MIVIVISLLVFFVFFAVEAFILNCVAGRKLKVYISGPMTGYKDLNFPAFCSMEKCLKNNFRFLKIVNPVNISKKTKIINYEATYEDFLREDFRGLIDCDAVILLSGWKDSGGCQKEIAVANSLKIPCFESLDDFRKFLEDKKNEN